MLRCTRVWFPSKHDFFFQASFLQLLKLQLSCANQFFTYSSSWLPRKYTAKTTIPFTLGITGIFQASYFFSNIDVMQCVGLENSYGISVKCRVLLKSIFPCYKFFCDISPCWRESQSFVSCKGCIKFSKILSYDRLKCIPILCGSYLRCIIDE